MKKENPTTKTAINKYKGKLARKALKLWFELGFAIKGSKGCEVCGTLHGTFNEKGKPQWLNGHHVEEKNNYALRFDPLNHVLLCPTCHKWGVTSAHRAPAWFIGDWMAKNRPEQLDYIMRNRLGRPSGRIDWSVEQLENTVEILEAGLTHQKNPEGTCKPTI